MNQIAQHRAALDEIESFGQEAAAVVLELAKLHAKRTALRTKGIEIGLRATFLDEVLPALPKLSEQTFALTGPQPGDVTFIAGDTLDIPNFLKKTDG